MNSFEWHTACVCHFFFVHLFRLQIRNSFNSPFFLFRLIRLIRRFFIRFMSQPFSVLVTQF